MQGCGKQAAVAAAHSHMAGAQELLGLVVRLLVVDWAHGVDHVLHFKVSSPACLLRQLHSTTAAASFTLWSGSLCDTGLPRRTPDARLLLWHCLAQVVKLRASCPVDSCAAQACPLSALA